MKPLLDHRHSGFLLRKWLSQGSLSLRLEQVTYKLFPSLLLSHQRIQTLTFHSLCNGSMRVVLSFFSQSHSSIGKPSVLWPPPWPQNPAVTALVNCSWKWLQIRGTQIPQGVSCTYSLPMLVWYSIYFPLQMIMHHFLHLPRAKCALQSKQAAE